MRVARISHLFYPDIVSDYLVELSMRQISMGHNIDVLTWNKNKRLYEEKYSNGLKVYRLPGLNFSIDGVITDYPFLPSLPQKINILQPDIIHGESHLFLTTLQAVKSAKRRGIPSVVTVHGVMSMRNAIINLLQILYLYTLCLWLFKNVDRIICLTKSDAREIVKFGCPPQKITIIPNAIDTNRFKSRNQHIENLVVWTGRFVPEKGLGCLINAAKFVVSEFRDVKFILIGDGPLKSKMINLANSYGLMNNNIYFLGPFNRDKVADFLSKASIFTLPSLKEGLPLSVLEAMASGTTVIASNIRGINDLIVNHQNGILIPPENPKLLAESIVKLLQDRNLSKRLSNNARNLVMRQFSWETVIPLIESVYSNVIGE